MLRKYGICSILRVYPRYFDKVEVSIHFIHLDSEMVVRRTNEIKAILAGQREPGARSREFHHLTDLDEAVFSFLQDWMDEISRLDG